MNIISFLIMFEKSLRDAKDSGKNVSVRFTDVTSTVKISLASESVCKCVRSGMRNCD